MYVIVFICSQLFILNINAYFHTFLCSRCYLFFCQVYWVFGGLLNLSGSIIFRFCFHIVYFLISYFLFFTRLIVIFRRFIFIGF